jgi:nucleoside-diphosphate-sugar epimerase
MSGLTIFGGRGELGRRYVETYYDQAIGNIASVNKRDDYDAHTPDILYFIYDYRTQANLLPLVQVLENWRTQQSGGVFNYVSTISVYGDAPSPAAEDAACTPNSHYGRTKWCEEQIVRAFCKAYRRDYRIIRLAHVIGMKDSRRALASLIKRLHDGHDIELWGDGEFFRDHIHVEDALRAIDLVATQGEHNTEYNVGTGKGWRYIDIIKVAAGSTYSRDKVKFVEKEAPTFYMDSTKLNNLGFKSKYLGHWLYFSESLT